MRLVKSGDATFEVHSDAMLIGRVWKYGGSWTGETKEGVAIGPGPWYTAREAGYEVERFFRRMA